MKVVSEEYIAFSVYQCKRFKVFKVLSRGSVNIHKKKELWKFFILTLEYPYLHQKYQVFLMLIVGTNSILDGECKKNKSKCTPK